MQRNTFFAGIGLLVVMLLAFWIFNMSRDGRSNPDKLDDGMASTRSAGSDDAVKAADPAKRCGNQHSYDLVGRELFRQAAATRGSGAAAFDRLASYAAVRVTSPILRRTDEGLNTVVCSGTVTIDLPPGVAVTGGRRSLTATIDYALQPAADGSGDVVTLTGADGIVVPLATLARTSENSAAPAAEPVSSAPERTVPSGPLVPRSAPLPNSVPTPSPPVVRPAPPPPRPTAPRPSAPPPTASSSPSFNCRSARTFGERAVCADDALASLDRQMAAQFSRASASADPEQRALLNRTRARFLGYRDGCRSNDCIADSYRGRMREIGDIMSGRWAGR